MASQADRPSTWLRMALRAASYGLAVTGTTAPIAWEPILGANRYRPAQTACGGRAVPSQVTVVGADRSRPAQTAPACAKRRSSS
jgi:hypothetical protein